MIIKKMFDRKSKYWVNDLGDNIYAVLLQKKFFNYMFGVKGYVFLGDVCENLGIRLEHGLYDLGWSKRNGDDRIDISFSNIEDTDNLEIIFECYPII